MTETHSKQTPYVHDFILGFADGLTVPFALTAGLSSLGDPKFVITAGLAELFSGSISMGLGAYLAAVTDRQRYQAEHQRLQGETEKKPKQEKQQIYQKFCSYSVGASRDHVQDFLDALYRDKLGWSQFVLDFYLKLEEPRRREAYLTALTMGLAYFIGGLLPMIPYFAIRHTTTALFISIGITAFILMIFGFLKAKYVGCTLQQSIRSAVLTLGVGVAAAGTSYGIVRAIQGSHAI